MSEQQPPPGTPEYLDSGDGTTSFAPEPTTSEPSRTSRRTPWLIGGGAVALLALGAGAWAALNFFQQGPQPAGALPSTTVAYVGVDLDPSGSQKIDAFRTLEKFPEFKDKVGVHSADDVRRKLGEEMIKSTGCDLSYADDVEPWLGDRAAFAAVDLGEDTPDTVVVVQVTDDSAAQAGLHTLLTCGDSPQDAGFDVHDGWAVLAQTQEVADQTVAATDHASLADDATYQRWTEAVGDSGVVNWYAAPAAGDYLASQIKAAEGSLGGFDLGQESGAASSSAESSAATPSAFHDGAAAGQGLSDGLEQSLRDFQGAAAVVRFTGSGLELATVSDPKLSQGGIASDQGGAVVSRLPDDTAAAIGIGLEPGWAQTLTDRLSLLIGGGRNGQQLLHEFAQGSGLDVPADLETLAGSSSALSISKDFDAEAATNSDDGTGVPVAFTVRGDADAIGKVLDKLRAQDLHSVAALGSDSSGDLIAIGPTESYRKQVLAGGHLGDSDAFTSVLPDAAHASVVVFVNVDVLQKAISQALGDDQEVIDNVAPLKAFGFSAWLDGDVARTSLKISTN